MSSTCDAGRLRKEKEDWDAVRASIAEQPINDENRAVAANELKEYLTRDQLALVSGGARDETLAKTQMLQDGLVMKVGSP
jgi:hypothetical protein